MISCLMDLSQCTPESVSRRKALAAALRQLRILSAEEEEEFAISCASVGGRKEAGDEVRIPSNPMCHISCFISSSSDYTIYSVGLSKANV